MSKYKALIFDYDDTLVKTYEVKWRQFKAVAKDMYGIHLTDDVLREHWGKPYDEAHRAYFRNSDTLENMLAAKLEREAEFPIELQPSALETVSRLREHGAILTILSSSKGPLVRADLKRLGFHLADFSAIQTSEETKVHKPNPEVFTPMLEHLAKQSIKPSDTIYVGDSLSDYQAAKAAGLGFIAVTTGITTAAEFRQAGAPTIIALLRELL